MTRRAAMIGLATAAFVLLVCVVLFADTLPRWCRVHGGDALIVVPIYSLAAVAMPRVRPIGIAAGTLAFATLVEFGQLYHSPPLDAFRRTFVGRMTIGGQFDPTDLACYLVGVALALAFDTSVASRFHRRSTE